MTDTAVPRGAHPQRRLSTRRKLGLSRASLIAAISSLVLGAIGAAISPSGGLVLASAAVLALIFLLLWQENEPPLLLFPAVFQWLAVSIKPLMTVFLRTPVGALSEFDIDIRPGIILGITAIAALSIGLRLGLGRSKQDWNAALKNEARSVTPTSALQVAVGTILVGHLLYFLMRFAGNAGQIIYAMANVRFAGLFALAYWCFTNRRGFGYLALVMGVEILIGITGFFSDFRTPIFIITFAALAVGHRPKLRDAALVAVLGAVLILFGSFWSAVKLDYRGFVSGGTYEQVITVPLSERLDYLAEEVKTFDGKRFADGFDKLLRRQSYIDYLSAVMSYVPEVRPYEHGERIGKTLIHILTPRILFPDKPATEFDSQVTAEYTGIPMQMREGTSISIGYVGELYIDFGFTGAVFFTFLIGLACGAAYRYLRQHGAGSLLLTYGARATVLGVLLPFDTALIKYVGGASTAFLAAYLLQRILVPYLSRQLRLKREYRTPLATGPAR